MADVETGALKNNRPWRLVECDAPNAAIKEGKHLILTLEREGKPPEDATREELDEFRLLAFDLAEKYASEPGKWRTCFNGPAAAKRKGHWHCHLLLPKGSDELPRLVNK